jgi:hypothetical protein
VKAQHGRVDDEFERIAIRTDSCIARIVWKATRQRVPSLASAYRGVNELRWSRNQDPDGGSSGVDKRCGVDAKEAGSGHRDKYRNL